MMTWRPSWQSWTGSRLQQKLPALQMWPRLLPLPQMKMAQQRSLQKRQRMQQ